ncbi:hypothetical protein ISS30_05510 [bacterium]|nr:hypothetical protein [bacterium]
MKIVIIACTLLTILSISANAVLVDGYCYLENQSNHEGTKVKFSADSPTAVTDSTYANNSGYYQINLTAGAYDVYLSHDGYFPDEILDQLLYSATTLPEVTLMQMPQGIPITGPQSGILVDTTYFVYGDISVESGDSLTIEAGATLIFNEDVQFGIDGYIHAAGTETDSVKFINSPDLTWGGIKIYYNWSPDSTSILEYCLITGSNSSGLYFYYSSPAISNCTISGNSASSSGGGLFIEDSNPTISHCTISGNSTAWNGGGLFLYDSSPSMSYCAISGNSANNNGGGLNLSNSSPTISNCTISGNSADYSGGGLRLSNSSPTISNCTISGNSASPGSGLYIINSSPAIINTIVEGNTGSGGVSFSSSPDASLTYNDFYNNENGNFGGSPPSYLGQIATVNANGDPCDMYYNIFENPLFHSTTGDSAYYLTAESPCIDAGDPALTWDPDGTPPDIGAYYFHQYLVLLNPFVLNFETVGVGENRTLPIWIINNSPSAVMVNEIFNANTVFYTNFTPVIEIDSGDSVDVMVTFQPDSMIAYDETLWVYTSIDTLTADLLGEGIASLIESEPDTLDFFALEVGMDSTLSLVFQNSGNDTLELYQIIGSEPVFTIDFPAISEPIFPGANSDTCWVTFTPTEEILYEDSLFVLCNAFNTVNDTFIVYLQGEGGVVPNNVSWVRIELYPDVVLTWPPVTTSIYGSPLTVDYYLIFFKQILDETFNFLAYTADTTYTHYGVVQFSPSMFYEVEAFIGEIGELEAFITANNGEFTKAEFMKRINR